MKKTSFVVGLSSILAALSTQAQSTTFDWTGSGGFLAQLTLDQPSSTDGSLSDITQIVFLDPASDGGPYGPYANYAATVNIPGYGPFTTSPTEFDSSDASLIGDFTWNASGITSMYLSWTPGSLEMDLAAGSEFGNSVTYVNYDAGAQAFDNTGLWVPSAPDNTGTFTLLAVAAVACVAAPKLRLAASEKA